MHFFTKEIYISTRQGTASSSGGTNQADTSYSTDAQHNDSGWEQADNAKLAMTVEELKSASALILEENNCDN
jgi:hypothetical protein